MNITSKGTLKVVPVFIVVITVVVWALSYHTLEFKGGLGVRDSGLFSYPRYSAQIGELPLWKDGEYQFTVRGLPHGPLDLKLLVIDATDADKAEVTSLSTFVTVSITDGSGKEVCAASGNLSDAKDGKHSTWLLASSSSSASFWQPRCQQLPISRFKTYRVRVGVSGSGDLAPHRILMPVLQGGGNELP